MRKILAGLVLLAVSGCSHSPSKAVLYDQALATGDWSAVELRERKEAAEGALPACLRSGGRRYCVDGDCSCVSPANLRRHMAQHDPFQGF